jgi:hypothetical protein
MTQITPLLLATVAACLLPLIPSTASAQAPDANTAAEQKEYLKKFEADLITSEEAAKWKRGASNAGYHYLGCAKTFALMGKAFADANLQMLNAQKR